MTNETKKHATIVRIDENACIGCTKCIAACPVDAIIGASKMMHTVIKEECIGCNLCIPPCPVDCIQIIPYQFSESEEKKTLRTKQRAKFRKERLEQQSVYSPFQTLEKKLVIQQILARTRAR